MYKYINIKSCNTYLKQGKSKTNLLLSSSSSNWKSHLYHHTINTNFKLKKWRCQLIPKKKTQLKKDICKTLGIVSKLKNLQQRYLH